VLKCTASTRQTEIGMGKMIDPISSKKNVIPPSESIANDN
jgi:hypothetical protein